MPSFVKVELIFEMGHETAHFVGSSSVERVINTSMRLSCGELVRDNQDAQVNYDDWQEWKPIVVTMTNALRDAIFRKKLAESPTLSHNVELSAGAWNLNKGEL